PRGRPRPRRALFPPPPIARRRAAAASSCRVCLARATPARELQILASSPTWGRARHGATERRLTISAESPRGAGGGVSTSGECEGLAGGGRRPHTDPPAPRRGGWGAAVGTSEGGRPRPERTAGNGAPPPSPAPAHRPHRAHRRTVHMPAYRSRHA